MNILNIVCIFSHFIIWFFKDSIRFAHAIYRDKKTYYTPKKDKKWVFMFVAVVAEERVKPKG
jgi:hypothetical protein